MKFTPEDIERMRNALIDASPLENSIKRLVKENCSRSLVHRYILENLAKISYSDYQEKWYSRLVMALSLLNDSSSREWQCGDA